MRDASGCTPLQVAQQTPKPNVTRWNFVAGELPDWNKCEQLLCRALASQNDNHSGNSNHSMPALPASSGYCVGDCNDTNCRTAVWEEAFRKALGNSVDARIGSLQGASGPRLVPELVVDNQEQTSRSLANPITSSTGGTATNQSAAEELGQPCTRCSKHSVVLYEREGNLVCKACFKAR